MTNKLERLVAAVTLGLVLVVGATSAVAQGNAFAYEGKLIDAGSPANGNYDFQIKLYDMLTGGALQGSPNTVTNPTVQVTNGIFTVQLDFGASAFPGADRFLEISVRHNSGESYVTLGPRQQITSTPYAIRALNAAVADGLSVACVNCVTSSQIASVNGSAIVGTIPPASIPSGSGSYIQNTTAPQASSNFNISATGKANIFDATTQYNIGGSRVLSVTGTGSYLNSNTFAGVGAGVSNTPNSSGDGNTNSFFGYNAGATNTLGSGNAFFGHAAGLSNTNGRLNAFFGLFAGKSNTTGSSNAFFGQGAGQANTQACCNSFFGYEAGRENTTGSGNSFFGTDAGIFNTTGGNNSFIGNSAGLRNTMGLNNSFFGRSGENNTTGSQNTIVGYLAGPSNTTENNNTFIGANVDGAAGITNASAIGANAKVTQSNSLVLGSINGTNGATADTNVGIGTTAPAERLHVAGNAAVTGTLNVSGALNVAAQYNIGASRVLSNAGPFNLFAGVGAGSVNTGTGNAFFGASAGANNSSGSENAFFGTGAGLNTTNGSFNSFFGQFAGYSNNSGHDNSFFGDGAGGANTTGVANSFFGGSAGSTNTQGGSNSFFGLSAGSSLTTENNNTLLGASSDGAATVTNATAIGYRAKVTQSNSLVLGSINGTNSATADTRVGIGATAPANPFDVIGAGTQSGGVAGFNEVAARFRQRTAGTHLALSIDALTGQDAILYLAENGDAVWGIRNDSDQGAKFQIRFHGAGASIPFTILPTGQVGLGTTSPQQQLSVNSGINLDQAGANTGGFNPGLTFGSFSGEGIASKRTAGGNQFGLDFFTNTANRLAITNSGDIGIGTTTPGDKLQVAGDIRVGTGTTGCVKDADGTVIAGGCSSDARFKRDITPFPRVLDRLVRLQPVHFYWRTTEYPEKAFGESLSFGLVAQDVERVLPELVTEDEKGYKAVRYNKLPLLMLQAIKELDADNGALKRENAALKARLDEQEARLRRLEAKQNF